VQYDFVLNL